MGLTENAIKLRTIFKKCANKVDLRGILGVSQYEQTYKSLLPVQREHLVTITGDKHRDFMEEGYLISVAYVFPDAVIDKIGSKKNGVYDKKSWNIYAEWYTTLNEALNHTTQNLAEEFNGIPLQATSTGLATHVKSVKDYFPNVISHRVHAENSGIGWRGKNSLIINPVYSCMIRLAGVITGTSLQITKKIVEDCGSCTSCLQVCKFLMYKDKLDDYREQCLKFMNELTLDEEVCGKCIKSCVYSPRFSKNRETQNTSDLSNIYYTTQ